MYPNNGSQLSGIFLAKYANAKRVGIHPNKNNKNLFCKLFIIINILDIIINNYMKSKLKFNETLQQFQHLLS
jgi:hypothetical protein